VTIVLVDTSALAKTVIEEPESPAVATWLDESSSTAEGLLVVSPR
jgi:predicted nucleic acid-binding protein